MPIIHISGPFGSGKTTLGRELSKDPNLAHYAIYDIDDLRAQYKKKSLKKGISGKEFSRTYAKGFQLFLDKIVKKRCKIAQNDDLPDNTVTYYKNIAQPDIIFVGLACFLFGEKYEYNGNWYCFPKVRFNLRPDYKFYINIPPEQNIRQIYSRDISDHIDKFCKWLKEKEDQIFRNLLEDEHQAKEKIFAMLMGPFNLSEHKLRINGWTKEHLKHEYVFATPQKIHKKILRLESSSANISARNLSQGQSERSQLN